METGSNTYRRYQRILWQAFAINTVMFVVELLAALQADSLSLMADSIDFFGDAGNYLVSVAVLGASVSWRAGTALIKGVFMLSFGLFIGVQGIDYHQHSIVPVASTMGMIGLLAMFANLGVAMMLFRFRHGDADMRTVWLCTRNDALSNIAVMLAALGVLGTASGWPDRLVAGVMALLAITSGVAVTRQSLRELKRNSG